MLKLVHVNKTYKTGDTVVGALNDVNIEFRKNEFVSILGPSGGGKTTLLNIIGGLDQYSSGDLIINGISTKKYKDRDWDSYRNHSVGFVFQNYNLISHQTVLSNVELTLTLSGASKKERKQRAKKVLEKVGLGDQLNKKPNQMSGGQMQRVAIARALVNNPDILLADEPTGALDTATSVQIMDLLKEIAKDRLVIMVTHNPELAEKYSTRVVKILDGKIVDDTDPYDSKTEEVKEGKRKKTSMSFFTALSLSFKNLLTKKGRTLLTSFAGSIGIIGIAAILALSNGVQLYINRIEEETSSSYPITIQQSSIDASSIMESMMTIDAKDENNTNPNQIYSKPIMMDMISLMSAQIQTNNLKDFKTFLDNSETVKEYANAVQYSYDLNLNIYKENNSEQGYLQTNPGKLFKEIGLGDMVPQTPDALEQFGGGLTLMNPMAESMWQEMFDNREVLESQYDLLSGFWPTKYNEVVLAVDSNNQINDYILYSLGLKNQDDLKETIDRVLAGETVDEGEPETFEYDELIGTSFKILLNSDYYVKENGMWIDKSDDPAFVKNLLEGAEELKVVGIIKPNEETVSTSINGSVIYTKELTEYVINKIHDSEITKEQISNPEVNVFTGEKFSDAKPIDMNNLTPEQKAYLQSLSPEELSAVIKAYSDNANATYENNLKKIGYVDMSSPVSVSIYAKDFDSKEMLSTMISDYNKQMESEGKEENVINYTDMVGMMIRSVTTIVDVVSYVLIAFVSISLIVSSIMIGIITYISVLERTKEIGVLRAMGASKKDISRVFNAETFIIGLTSGTLGIITTAILCIPANIVIKNLTGISGIANLPIAGAFILIAISMFLTIFAGLVPSRIAAKKDPVISLRSE